MSELIKEISFGKLDNEGMGMPHLLDIQTRAFEALLQLDAASHDREDIGLERVFKDLFPITDVHENFSLEFVRYTLAEPKYTVEECIERDMTYSAPLKATLQLVINEEVNGVKRPRNIIEKEVYLGELPLLTGLGTFVINGAERVIVSQLHRSPGVVFEEATHPNGQRLISARIIPFRGSWVEFTVDIHDVIYVHITKKRESRMDQREVLGAIIAQDIELPGEATAADAPKARTKKARAERERAENVLLVKEGDELTEEVHNRLRRQNIDTIKVFSSYMSIDLRDEQDAIERGEREVRRRLAQDVVDDEGEVVAEAGQQLSDALIKKIRKADITKVFVFVPSGRAESTLIKNTLGKDPTHTEREALSQIYALLRPGDAPDLSTAKQALERLFFSPKRYDLGRVGRYKINQRLGLGTPASTTVLTKEDFVAILRYLVELHEGRGHVDDIDHLGNRRIRSVGELIANQFSVGLSRMARLVKERMSINTDPEKISLDDLVNARTVSAVIQAFFGSSQLSQFMDQTNPLAELTHKRRLSALGPGGLSRERAGFDVRDVHPSHYGRMCPIETPEGPNIGLIGSLATYGKINNYGFIETPYRKVRKLVSHRDKQSAAIGQVLAEDLVLTDGGKPFAKAGATIDDKIWTAIKENKVGGVRIKPIVTDEIEYLDAAEEEKYFIAQANAPLDESQQFVEERVMVRYRDEFRVQPAEDVDYMDVSPKQIVSVATAMIPFLEHDDANRALMGSNMMRQSVPLLQPEAPVVGTGVEYRAAFDSQQVVIARGDGTVVGVTSGEIIVERDEGNERDTYPLKKFLRSNQGTCINQRPVVDVGTRVAAGDVLADGSSTDGGEMALGQNILVAFLPWEGGNYEDAIVISERLVKDDLFTSIHIEKHEIEARDTKLGPEEITRDIPNVGEESLRNLDEDGIIYEGAEVT